MELKRKTLKMTLKCSIRLFFVCFWLQSKYPSKPAPLGEFSIVHEVSPAAVVWISLLLPTVASTTPWLVFPNRDTPLKSMQDVLPLFPC